MMGHQSDSQDSCFTRLILKLTFRRIIYYAALINSSTYQTFGSTCLSYTATLVAPQLIQS